MTYISPALLPEKYWFPLRFHKQQAEAFHCNKRFVNLACGRQSGKTEIARRKIVSSLPMAKPWPDPTYLYCLPTFQQAKRVAWKRINDMIPKDWVKERNLQDMCVTTKFGSMLYIAGLDQPQRVEGLSYDGVIIDESSDIKEKVFDLSIMPALSVRKGWCWRIGVPKRYGIGAPEYKAWFMRGLNNQDKDIVSYTWPSSDLIDESEIEDARMRMDIKDFREQYEASWETAGGGIFHAFGQHNIDDTIGYDKRKPLCIGMDFNVDPMAWVVGHVIKNDDVPMHHPHWKRIEIFDEIWLRDTNTIEALQEVWGRYGDHKAGFRFYGDATSRARKTAAVKSDYLHICNSEFPKKKVLIPRSNPTILDRFASTNAVLQSADGNVRCKIHPRCKHLIQDLGDRSYKEGSRIADDHDDIGHITDAFGYLIWHELPLRIESSALRKVIMANMR